MADRKFQESFWAPRTARTLAITRQAGIQKSQREESRSLVTRRFNTADKVRTTGNRVREQLQRVASGIGAESGRNRSGIGASRDLSSLFPVSTYD